MAVCPENLSALFWYGSSDIPSGPFCDAKDKPASSPPPPAAAVIVIEQVYDPIEDIHVARNAIVIDHHHHHHNVVQHST